MDINDIPEEWRSHFPTLDTFPENFNQSQKAFWQSSIDSMIGIDDAKDAWEYCIEKFISNCYESCVDPFNVSANVSNDTLIDDLKSQYREVLATITRLQDRLVDTYFDFEFTNAKSTVADQTWVILNYKCTTGSEELFHNYLLSNEWNQVNDVYEYRCSKGANLTLQGRNLKVVLSSSQLPFISDNYVASKSELQDFVCKIVVPSFMLTSNPV